MEFLFVKFLKGLRDRKILFRMGSFHRLFHGTRTRLLFLRFGIDVLMRDASIRIKHMYYRMVRIDSIPSYIVEVRSGMQICMYFKQ